MFLGEIAEFLASPFASHWGLPFKVLGRIVNLELILIAVVDEFIVGECLEGLMRVGLVLGTNLVGSECAQALNLLDLVVLKAVLARVFVVGRRLVLPDAPFPSPVCLARMQAPWIIILAAFEGSLAGDIDDWRVVLNTPFLLDAIIDVGGSVGLVCVVGNRGLELSVFYAFRQVLPGFWGVDSLLIAGHCLHIILAREGWTFVFVDELLLGLFY